MLDARKLRRLREEAGLSQGELAAKIGVRNDTVSRWENRARQPWGRHLAALARVLGVPREALEGDAGSPAGSASLGELLAGMDPVMQAAARAFIEGLAASGSVEAAGLAARAAEAIERARRTAGERAGGPSRPRES